ncbi:YraN family protein [Compostibacter hankyongensis]|uniref:UPF0102 protein GCM10023143_12490 n=1 Tax=Compostibacter hankyongensis TaxID=1007089 RepID=A0ABP8FL97_9BACT
MDIRQRLGQTGEDLAAAYLQQQGYRILHKNWRRLRKEIDLIARDGSTLVFIEVKTRQGNAYGVPELAVDARKQEHIQMAAELYLAHNPHGGDLRFDIVAITYRSGTAPEIHHVKDAFF